MRRALDRAVAQLSALLLLSGVCLIGASLLGVGTGPLLFGALLAATVALYLARDAVPRIERFPEWALADLGSDLWLAPLIAASAVLVAPGATPGEVQSIGFSHSPVFGSQTPPSEHSISSASQTSVRHRLVSAQ